MLNVTTSGFDVETIDSYSPEQLRARLSSKWNHEPGAMGAWIAESDFGVAPAVREALFKMIDMGRLGYPTEELNTELVEAMAQFQAERYGWEVNPRSVVAVPDVLIGLAAVMDHYISPAGKVIVPTPCYMPFMTLPGAYGKEIIQVPTEDGTLRLDALNAAFDQGGEVLIWCNPHNPLGRVAGADEMLEIAEVVAQRGGIVFSDEIHAPLVYPEARHIPFASVSETAAQVSLTATSASKAWNLAGLKCAQLIFTNASHLKSWNDGIQHCVGKPAMPGMIANIAAYSHGVDWLNDEVTYLDANRQLTQQRLGATQRQTGMVAKPSQATYLAWIDARGMNVTDPQEFMLKNAGVELVGGELCGDVGRGFLRFSYATPRPVLETMLDRMITAAKTR